MSYQGVVPVSEVIETNPGDIIWREATVSLDDTEIVLEFASDSPKTMYVKVTTVGSPDNLTFGPSITWIGGTFPGYLSDASEIWKFFTPDGVEIFGTKIGIEGEVISTLANGVVGTTNIIDAAVTAQKIASSAVTASKVATNAIGTSKIIDANITTDKIADSNITTAKIADAAVTTIKITDANVTYAKLASTSIGAISDIISGTANKLVISSELTKLYYGCHLYQTSSTTLPNNLTSLTTILFDTELYDDAGWHSTSVNTGRITVDYTGRINLCGHVNFGTSGNAVYAIAIKKNGTVIKYIEQVPSAGGSTLFNKFSLELNVDTTCTSGDYFELCALTNWTNIPTGTGLSGTSFTARRIG